MDIEFKKAVLPADIDRLMEFDLKIFGQFPDDIFDLEEWSDFESYWMYANGIKNWLQCIPTQRRL